ncbi:MAG: DUF4349 domain-containing protein [Bacteroidia bacterium]|nr:DUF4349 domain-containing protein [Bacteroidia bacterium]
MKFNIKPILLLSVFFSLSACGTFKSYDEAVSSSTIKTELGVSEADGSLYGQGLHEKLNPRKIVYSAFLSMEVKEPEMISEKLGVIANSYKGYVASTGNRRVVIRIPFEKFENALEEVNKLGEIEDKVVKGQDVTEDFLDLEIRLENAQKARKRYLELLDKAQNVEEALKVEKELERLNREIDLLKGKINRLSNLSSFATITVNFIDLEEQPKPGPLGYIFVGLYKGVKWLFIRN